MTIPIVTPADLPAARVGAGTRPRIWMRSLSFGALCLYGVDRWGRLMSHPPGWRLLGLALLAVALAVLVPLVRHLATAWPAHAGRILAAAFATGLMLAAFPVAGLQWQWVVHARIAVSARAIGSGLSSLGDVLVPYLGHAYPVRLVIMLGAAVLLLDAAAALAFATRSSGEVGDGRRAAAALPLIALAIVPATLVRPAAPALQGLLLFGLLALFIWGERIPRDGLTAALGVGLAAGVAAAIAGPLVEQSHAWVNYRAWAGSPSSSQLESFDWNQSYGPLAWPARDRTVLIVHAHRGDYWKATDLTDFNGVEWVAGEPGTAPALPRPAAFALRRWTQPVQVTIDDLQTSEVIGGSGITGRPELAGGVEGGDVFGTWMAERALGPGDAYTVRTYSPSPSPAALRRVDEPNAYPWRALTGDLTLSIPTAGGSESELPFPSFHAPVGRVLRAALGTSPYAPAFRLARRLAADSATPEDFVARVERYLDSGDFVYDQQTRASTLPLLDFLFHTHVGYCQQFSGAMALLLRMGGVPARIAAGFTSGQFDPTTQAWTVTDIDAHAWVEVWFPSYGWVKFDPTPSTDPALGGGTGEPALERRRFAFSASHSQTRTHSQTTTRRARVLAPAHGGPASGAGGGASPSLWIGAGALAALLAAGAGGWALARRRRDPLSELERALARTGRPLQGSTTLAALERRFRDSPEAAAYVRALRLERYGHASAAPSPAGRRALRAELRSGLGLRGRLRALWALPPRVRLRRGDSRAG